MQPSLVQTVQETQPNACEEMMRVVKQHFHLWLDDDVAFPENSPFWRWLDDLDWERLKAFFLRVVDRVSKANGYVVEHSPVISFCAGCHNNTLLLGAAKQARSAMLCVSPCTAKGKFQIATCLTILNQCRLDIE